MTGGPELLERRATEPLRRRSTALRERARRPLLDRRPAVHRRRRSHGARDARRRPASRSRWPTAGALLEALLVVARPSRCRRRARQRRRPRGAGAARRARRQAGVRHDEPRRADGCELGARRPDDGLRRRGDRRVRPRRRQGPAAHRRRRRRDGADARGVRRRAVGGAPAAACRSWSSRCRTTTSAGRAKLLDDDDKLLHAVAVGASLGHDVDVDLAEGPGRPGSRRGCWRARRCRR